MPDDIERLYLTMTLKAGRDTLRTKGWFGFDAKRHCVDLVIQQTTASSRFFAEHYGRTIEVHIERVPDTPK